MLNFYIRCQEPFERANIFFPIIQMKILKLRGDRVFVQGHMASKQREFKLGWICSNDHICNHHTALLSQSLVFIYTLCINTKLEGVTDSSLLKEAVVWPLLPPGWSLASFPFLSQGLSLLAILLISLDTIFLSNQTK